MGGGSGALAVGVLRSDRMEPATRRSARKVLRKAVTTLQSVHNFYGDKADAEAVVEVSGTLPDDCIEALSAAIRSNVRAIPGL